MKILEHYCSQELQCQIGNNSNQPMFNNQFIFEEIGRIHTSADFLSIKQSNKA